jgi:5-methylcytosine-specific restriction protein A
MRSYFDVLYNPCRTIFAVKYRRSASESHIRSESLIEGPMTIREAIATILAGYGPAKSQGFAGHALARVARHDFPDAVRADIPEERYLIEGSAGQGQWAQVPWLAVFDRLITNTARQGFYIVYLFRSDLSGVYLSLNQGVTSIRDVYGADAKKSLVVRAADYRARLVFCRINNYT